MDIPNTSSTTLTAQMCKSPHRGHDIITKTIKTPSFSYINLQLIPASPTTNDAQLDALTIQHYIGLALSQFLGLTGSAISIDIVKVEGVECWIRVPREDLNPVLAAVGGWVGPPGSQEEDRVGWRVKGSGNWLGLLIAQAGAGHVWDD
ncbi:hypothetical protein LZ554_006536 [Drepanopeziza brunnea f. sp. 'monogermtubi']|nr:hypothetical protein LZ554_006536 [Drepanopeziza brunnea f. sp. 'monogermtubi']